MDPAEMIFSGLLRLWKRVRPGAVSRPEGAASLEAQRERLENLGALLFGEAMTVTPANDAGGLRGETLLLPRHVALFEDPEANDGVYVYRVAFAAAARDLGLDGAAPDGAVGALACLMATPAILDHLHAQYPATRETTARLAAAELEGRPEASAATEACLLESLLQTQLRAAAGAERAAPPSSSEAEVWLRGASASALRDSKRAQAMAEASHHALRSLGLPAGAEPPQSLIWGRLWRAPAHTLGAPEEAPERESRAASDRRIVEIERTIRLERRALGPREDKPLFHVFEKLETAEDYAGQSGTPDASGTTESMEDALNDLSLGVAIRTAEEPQNLARADVIADEGGFEVAGGGAVDPRVFVYPEWHHGRGEYRADWVTLTERRLVVGPAHERHRETARAVLRERRGQIEEIRGQLMRALRQRRARARHSDGPEIDIQAMVERHADLAAGQTPSDRLYVSARRSLREVAVLVLVDTSFSTDAWLDGQRVLDVEVESLLVLSAALEGVMDEEIAVASFSSHTRRDVRFDVLKGFEDPWEHLRAVAPALAPDGYTRIGAAVRHGAAILDAAHARKKLLLILSDGKPIDFDRYEGRYGVEDVGRAVREASEARIHCFGLAIEKEAKLHLARMLGPGRYRILPRTSRLPEVMADAFLDLLTG